MRLENDVRKTRDGNTRLQATGTIEYQLEGISQTQISLKKGMTFAIGLRSVLRQDPDIIMVGEIRDAETAMMAVQAALTGHLVFSTLHTNDAASAVTRMMEVANKVTNAETGFLRGKKILLLDRDTKVYIKVPRAFESGSYRTDSIATQESELQRVHRTVFPQHQNRMLA